MIGLLFNVYSYYTIVHTVRFESEFMPENISTRVGFLRTGSTLKKNNI